MLTAKWCLSVSIFTSQQSRSQCASEAGENQKGETHHDEAQYHHERQTLRALKIFKYLLRLRVGTSRGGLLNSLQQGVAQLRARTKDQHFDCSEDREDAESKCSAQRA